MFHVEHRSCRPPARRNMECRKRRRRDPPDAGSLVYGLGPCAFEALHRLIRQAGNGAKLELRWDDDGRVALNGCPFAILSRDKRRVDRIRFALLANSKFWRLPSLEMLPDIRLSFNR